MRVFVFFSASFILRVNTTTVAAVALVPGKKKWLLTCNHPATLTQVLVDTLLIGNQKFKKRSETQAQKLDTTRQELMQMITKLEQVRR